MHSKAAAGHDPEAAYWYITDGSHIPICGHM
jgi:hypothetical protein